MTCKTFQSILWEAEYDTLALLFLKNVYVLSHQSPQMLSMIFYRVMEEQKQQQSTQTERAASLAA
jgi:hypothetical protein